MILNQRETTLFCQTCERNYKFIFPKQFAMAPGLHKLKFFATFPALATWKLCMETGLGLKPEREKLWGALFAHHETVTAKLLWNLFSMKGFNEISSLDHGLHCAGNLRGLRQFIPSNAEQMLDIADGGWIACIHFSPQLLKATHEKDVEGEVSEWIFSTPPSEAFGYGSIRAGFLPVVKLLYHNMKDFVDHLLWRFGFMLFFPETAKWHLALGVKQK